MRQKKIRSMIIAVIIVSVITAVLYFGLNIKNVLEVKEQTTKSVSTIDKDNEDVTEKKQVKPSKEVEILPFMIKVVLFIHYIEVVI